MNCLAASESTCVILLISVRMRAPSAPHMSFGSRATRRNLKRGHPIPSDELSGLFVLREPKVRLSARRVLLEPSSPRVIERCTVARHGAETKDRAESRIALATNEKFEDDIPNLIETGKEKGYLTYGDVNDILPEEMGSPDDMDDLLTTISGQGIDLLDAPKFGSDKDFELEEPARMSNST